MKWFISLFIVIVIVSIIAFVFVSHSSVIPTPILPVKNSPVASLTQTTIPSFSHVYVIMFENHNYADIIGNPQAPYINSLAKSNAVARNMIAEDHPSLPNYFAFTAGTTFGITSDCNTCFQDTTQNIFSQLEKNGKTWKSYHESMPGNCYLSDVDDTYVLHHNPAAYYLPLRDSCQHNDVPYSQFNGDLANNATGDFTFIIPDNAHNMHTGSIAEGDAWLAKELPKILASSSYQHNGVVFFTYDEGRENVSPNQILTIVVSSLAKKNFTSSQPYDLNSLLRTITDGLHISPLGKAAQSTPMSDFFPQ